jgi:protein SCO1/2
VTSSRLPRALLLGLVGLLAAALLTACGGSASSTPRSAPHYASGTEVGQQIPAELRKMAFTDEHGRTVHLSDYAGRTVVLQDVMTLCQELCPIDTATFVSTARQYQDRATDPSDTVFLSITVDPERDTPAQLRAYRKQYAGSGDGLPQWHLLTGSPADLAALWKFLGVYVHRVPQDGPVRNWRTGQRLTYDVQHSDEVFFLDGTGEEQYLLEGMPSLGDHKVPGDLQHFMSARGHRNEQKHSGWTADQALGVLAWLHHRAG